MRRFLSWIVLVLLTIAFYTVQLLAWYLVVLIYTFLYKISHIIFWAIVISGGFGLAWFAFAGLSMLAPLIIQWTQNVCHTQNGTRYKVVGILTAIYFALNAIATVFIVLKDLNSIANPLIQILSSITMIVFGIILTTSAKETAEQDGPPLTERERLQAKLDRLDEKENRMNRYGR